MATVVLVGMLDTKAEEYGWLRSQLEAAGCEVVVVDVGSFTEDSAADIPSSEVASRSGADVELLLHARDRGAGAAAPGHHRTVPRTAPLASRSKSRRPRGAPQASRSEWWVRSG